MNLNIADLRKEYVLQELDERDVNADPITQFLKWLDEAINSEVLEPTAFVLSTSSRDAKPTSRVVLLKKVDSNGFVFYTNYNSRKGKHLLENPFASMLFFWPELERQVRIDGLVKRSDDQESDLYFLSRPLQSKISAVVSPQSEVIPGRDYLETKIKEFKSRNINVTRPDNWGGYILFPGLVEFWQGRKNRLHDRVQYTFANGEWKIERLAP